MDDNISTTQQTVARFNTDTRPTDYVGVVAELTIDIKETRARVHDGITKGGIPLAKLDEIFSKKELTNLLGSYVLKTEQYSNDKIDTMLKEYYRKSEADNKMQDLVEPQKAKIVQIEHTLLSKADKPYVDERIRTYSAENIDPIYAKRINTYNKTEIDNLLATTTNDLSRDEIDKIKANIASNDATLDTRQELVDTVKTNKTNIDTLNTLVNSDDTDLTKLQETVAFIKANKPVLDALTLDAIAETATKKHLTTELRDKLQQLYTKGELDIKFDSIDVKLGNTVTKTHLGERLNIVISAIANEYATKNDVYTKQEVDNKLISLKTTDIKDGLNRKFITDDEHTKLTNMYLRKELDEFLKEAFLVTPSIAGNNKLTISFVKNIVTINKLKNRFIVYNGYSNIEDSKPKNVWYVDSDSKVFEIGTTDGDGGHLSGCVYKVIKNNVPFIKTNFLNKAVKVLSVNLQGDEELITFELANEKTGKEADGIVIEDIKSGKLLLAIRGIFNTNLGVTATTVDEWYWLSENGNFSKNHGENIVQAVLKPLTSTSGNKILINITQPIILGFLGSDGSDQDAIKETDINQNKGIKKNYETNLWGLDEEYLDPFVRKIVKEELPPPPTLPPKVKFAKKIANNIDKILSEAKIDRTRIFKITSDVTGDKTGIGDGGSDIFDTGLVTTVNGKNKLFTESVDLEKEPVRLDLIPDDSLFIYQGIGYYREDVSELDSIRIKSNYGSDSNTSISSKSFMLNVDGVRYSVFRSVKTGGDPSANLFVYIKEGTEFDSFTWNVNGDDQNVYGYCKIFKPVTIGWVFITHVLPSSSNFTDKEMYTFISSFLRHTQDK